MTFASCSTDVREASAECNTAMERAASERDSARAEPLIDATLDACQSAEEWLTALRDHPEAMGLTSRATIGEVDLQSACVPRNSNTRVCKDAVNR